jgi:WD40 repeat protein
VAIDPKGGWVAAASPMEGGKVWVWPLTGGTGKPRVLEPGVGVWALQASPDGRLLAAGSLAGVHLLPLDGRPPQKLPGFEGMTMMPAFDREGRRLAAGGGFRHQTTEAVTRVWDLQTGEVQVLDAGDGKAIASAAFLPDGRLLTGGQGGLRLWEPVTQRSTVLREGDVRALVSPDGRYAVGVESPRPGVPSGTAFVYDIRQRRQWNLEAHGDAVTFMAWDPAGTRVVTGSRDGVVRVGPLTGEEPHLLLGHEGAIWGVDVGPGGRWIASSSEDRTVRLWPMPEGPPFHALPYDELLERLRSLINYRVIADAASPGGYRTTFAPFAGWNRQPPVW